MRKTNPPLAKNPFASPLVRGQYLFVATRGVLEGLGYPAAQAGRRENFHVGAELQDLHQELPVGGEGNFQQVAAALLEARALLGVPDLRRHPARTLGREAQIWQD